MNLFVHDPRIELTQTAARQLQRFTEGGRSLIKYILKCLADAHDDGASFEKFECVYTARLPGEEDTNLKETLGFRILFREKKDGLKIVSIELGAPPPKNPKSTRAFGRVVLNSSQSFMSFAAVRLLKSDDDSGQDKFVIRMQCRSDLGSTDRDQHDAYAALAPSEYALPVLRRRDDAVERNGSGWLALLNGVPPSFDVPPSFVVRVRGDGTLELVCGLDDRDDITDNAMRA